MKAQSNIPVGYTVQSVITRISALDVDAAGNGEKAAWKRYLTLALLSIAKGWDTKKVAELVFGKGVKPSKTFQNMTSLARKCRNTMIGNGSWTDIKVMSIDDAQNAVLDMLNRHMAVLSCTSKNEYEKFCDLSPMEAEDKRETEKADAAQAASEKADTATKEAETLASQEADAKDAATARPERTPAEAAIAALAEADRDNLMTVAAHIAGRMSIEDMAMMRDALDAMIANAAPTIAIAA